MIQPFFRSLLSSLDAYTANGEPKQTRTSICVHMLRGPGDVLVIRNSGGIEGKSAGLSGLWLEFKSKKKMVSFKAAPVICTEK